MEDDAGQPCLHMQQQIKKQGGWFSASPELPTLELINYIQGLLQFLDCQYVLIQESTTVFSQCCAPYLPLCPPKQTSRVLVILVWPPDTDSFFKPFETIEYKGILVLGPALGLQHDVNPYDIVEKKQWVSIRRTDVPSCSREDILSHASLLQEILHRPFSCGSVQELFVQYPHEYTILEPSWWNQQFTPDLQLIIYIVRLVSQVYLYGPRALLCIKAGVLTDTLQKVYALTLPYASTFIDCFAGVTEGEIPSPSICAMEIKAVVRMLQYFESTSISTMPAALQTLNFNRSHPEAHTSKDNQILLLSYFLIYQGQLPNTVVCAACFSKTTGQQCRRCKENYCSTYCYTAHWRVHKTRCVK